MRTMEEQTEGLRRLVEAACNLHRVNLVIREAGGLMEATGYKHAADTSVVYVTGGYDLWTYDMTDQRSCCEGWDHCQGHMIKSDLSLEDAAAALADAYMEAKARHVITHVWGDEPQEAERILSDPEERARFFRKADAGSDRALARKRRAANN